MPGCDEWFIPKTYNHKYCSCGCKNEANYWRNRDYKLTHQKKYQSEKIRKNTFTGYSKSDLKKELLFLREENMILRQENQQIKSMLQSVLDELRGMKEHSFTQSVERDTRPAVVPEFTIEESAVSAEDATAAMLASLDSFF